MQRMAPVARHRALAAGALRAAACLVLAALLAAAPREAGAAEEPHPTNVYVRTMRDYTGTMRYLEAEAERIGATQVIVAFDAATFDPPPGLTEFSLEYPFFSDLEQWLGALGDWARTTKRMLRGTSSLAPKTLDLKQPGAIGELNKLILKQWWDGERPAELPRASRWMRDALVRTEDAVRAEATQPVRMLVLIAGSVTPERWVRADADKGYETKWRTKLQEIGTYFDEGRVGALLGSAGCRFYVVAPEARFGDFAPYVELPELPWAARPHLPAGDMRFARGPTTGSRGGVARRRALEKALEETIPDPAERRKRVEELLRQSGSSSRAPGFTAPHGGGLRFLASTPVWFPMCGGTVPINNHAPSGYGIWPYARVAARTGGKYVFYPFPQSRWLDDCVADYALINQLAPELVSRQRYIAKRRRDTALAAQARAAALVFDETPWSDTHYGHRAARAWSAFPSTSPLKMEDKVFLRRKPYDDALQGSEDGIERIGERLHEDVLPRYDRALLLLDKAVAACHGEIGERVHPRSHANLLLTRFWFAMSAFHLDAYSIYAREIERFVPASMKGHVDGVVVTYVPTIRMSDVLDAYDGRRLSLDDESKYRRWTPGGAPGYQGNILDIPVEEPDFRARRNTAKVLEHLDPRLRRRALRMIEAARAVMRTYGRTGWGWTTYYSEAFTFIFTPLAVPRGHRPSRGGGKAPPRPTTPRGGGSGKGGSKGGGATTGGK